MSKTYTFFAWCVRPFMATFDIEANSPEEALAIGRRNSPQRLDTAEPCNRRYPWDEFAVDDEYGNELLHVLDDDARRRASAHAATLLLDMIRYGLVTITDGDAEFNGTIYWFDDTAPDWNAVVNAIGWDKATAALAQAKAA
jgi:hypothetical protein